MGAITRTSLIGAILVAGPSIAPPAIDGDHAERDVVASSRAVSEHGAEGTIEDSQNLEPAEVVGASARQRRQVDRALEAFAEAGLELPTLVIRYSDDTDLCEGNLGMFRARPKGESDLVSVCSKMRITLVHELAHAWDHHALDDERRRAFTDYWGLDNWNDASQEWHDRASERAAHTIAYTLLLDEVTDNPDILKFVCGYSVLTGDDLPELAAISCRQHPTTPPTT